MFGGLLLGWVGSVTVDMPNVATIMARRTKGEGSAYMRKDGRAAASIIYEGKRITKYGKTKTEAKQRLDAYMADLKAGKIVIGPKQTVEQYLTHWLEDSRRLRIDPSTLEFYRIILRVHLIPAFGSIQLDRLSREQVQAFCAALFDSGLSSSYIKEIHMLLSSALKDAVDNGFLARNVCDRVILPRAEKYEAHFLTLEESKRLIEAARGHRLWLFILMGITTGARRGELTGLRWSDIDLAKGVVCIRRTVARLKKIGLVEKDPKSESSVRRVRLSQVVIDGLEAQKRYIADLQLRAGKAWQENDLLFPNRHGRFMDRWVISYQFREIWKEAGLSYLRFHDLRHSAATLLLAAGVHIKVVQEILGHSNVQITLQMYGHVLPDMQQNAVDKINNMFQ